ncbi:MAG: 3-hydroxy-3-methylglutaryl-CoA reductase [Firmicutes bacterium]|nr:3-hydroxy-3-methylglutaryl-CoA reductase [Bacillota bacterium]
MRYRWSHRNHPQAIAERQEILRQRREWSAQDEVVFRWSVPPERLASFQECLTGEMVLPVGVVGPLVVSLGQYRVGPEGEVAEIGRAQEEVFVPLAHTEGGLSASMLRGMRAAEAAGGVTTYLLHDQMTRDSAFLFKSTREAVAFAGWIEANHEQLRRWANDPDNPLKQRPSEGLAVMSSHARLLRVDTRVIGSVCHLLYRFWTGEACGPNMMTRNAYALNRYIVEASGFTPENVFLEANLGGDKKPSHEYYAGGHGKTVLASVTLTHEVLRHHLHISAEALKTLEWAGLHGAHASGMQSFGFTPASAVAAIFAVTGQDLGMVGTSSMAHGTLHAVPEGIVFTLQLGGIEVGTIGGGTSLPHAQAYLRMMGCEGPGSAQRLAQIIAAATLCLEVSAAASMASRGSENFFRAHWERGGHRS